MGHAVSLKQEQEMNIVDKLCKLLDEREYKYVVHNRASPDWSIHLIGVHDRIGGKIINRETRVDELWWLE